MRCLIDTQILLWSVYQPEKIPSGLASRLIEPASEILFSSVSLAEIAIKFSLGRADFPFLPDEVGSVAIETGFTELPLTWRQSARLAGLPWHHRDPFDRLLVAQALEEGLKLITTDGHLSRYSDLVERIPGQATIG
ncbi:MAG: type II toxin-antitoxin system VapC family toxin [Rhodocyclaceae bacterium]|nr:type II toxin-antitoxin system VapC family toxin [Rhodocyclaceae bacterium]